MSFLYLCLLCFASHGFAANLDRPLDRDDFFFGQLEFSEEFAAKLDRLLDTDDAHIPLTARLERIKFFLHSATVVTPALEFSLHIAAKLDRLLDTSALFPPSLPFSLEHARLPSATQLSWAMLVPLWCCLGFQIGSYS